MPEWTTLIRARLQQLSTKAAPDADIIEELAAHLQDRYRELIASGADERAAIDAALDELTEEDLRAFALERRRLHITSNAGPPGVPSSGRWFTDWWRDLKYGARVLSRNPGFSTVVVLTLAFGIAANTTAFTVINSLLMTPLPVARPAELVEVYTRGTKEVANADERMPLSYLNLKDIAEHNDVFSDLAGHSHPMSVTISDGATPQRMFAELVTGNYFETLGIHPLTGRFFRPEEDRAPGGHPVLVLGYVPWQLRFGGRADIVGRTIRLNGTTFTVVGVAPEGFKGLNGVFGPDVWIPSAMTEQVVPAGMRSWLRDRAALGFRAVGRLRPGVTRAEAESTIATRGRSLERDYPDANRGRSLALVPVSRASLAGMSPQAAVIGSIALMAIPGLVLLIACSNVANLLLARATTRRQEIAVRMALGAGRARLVRQLLTESVLLGLIAGAAGVGLAFAGARLLWSFRPPEFAQNLVDVRFDFGVVLFAVGVSIVTALIFGAAPALAASRPDVVTALKDDVRTVGQNPRLVSWRHTLLVGQVALSFMALMTAALFLRSVQRSYAIDPGFERQHVGIILMNPGQAGYDQPRAEALYHDIRTRVAALPGVRSVSWATNLPLFSSPSRNVLIEGREKTKDSDGVRTVVNTIDLDYFATAGVTLLSGRDFTEADRGGDVRVAIINDTMARKYWPGRDPLGQRISFAGDPAMRQIVGIAKTVNYTDLGEAPQPCVYLPLAQNFTDAVVLYVRTASDPAQTLTAVQHEIRQIDRQIDVGDVRTATKLVEQALFGATMGVGLLGVFGLVALGLASLGMYGVMAHSVTLRQREMAVRMALGASGGAVLRLVVRQGMTLVGIGLLLGGAGSLLIGAALSRTMYGVSGLDPIGFIVATFVLTAVAALASYLPARRASRLDPLTTLRST